MQCIIERTQIRIHLALQITRQKSELLSRLDRRSCQNNAADLITFKRLDRHCHRKICLSGSRRSHAKHDHFLADLVHVFLLPGRLWLDRLSLNRPADNVRIDLHQL